MFLYCRCIRTLLTPCIDALPTIKPNTDGQLLKEITTQDEIIEAQDLHKRGIKIIVVSLGAQGALMVSDEGTL